jgi:hypothetical protein
VRSGPLDLVEKDTNEAIGGASLAMHWVEVANSRSEGNGQCCVEVWRGFAGSERS